MTIQFEVGKTYSGRFIGDNDLKFTYQVIARTRMTVTLKSTRETVKRKVRVYEGVEQCNPMGQYSMAPILTAEKGV